MQRDPLHPAAVAARVSRWEHGQAPGPLTLELYPTLSCNLDCLFCDTTDRHRPPVDELSDERLLTLVDEAAALGVRRVFVLGGGEPLVRKALMPALMRRVKSHGMEGVLTTNGTLLGPSLARVVAESGWDEIQISIDGADAATHDALRGRAGTFRRAVRNACRLSVERRRAGARTPRLGLHFVLTNRNWRQLSGVIRLARAIGAERVDFDALIAYRPEQLALRLSDEQRAAVPEVAREALALARQWGITTTLEHLLQPERLDRGQTRLPPPPDTAHGLAAAPCLRAWHWLVVAADGRVSPCCVLAGQGGSLAGRSLAEVWRGDSFLSHVRQEMSAGRSLARCAECSWNILAHEVEIRRHLGELP